MPLRVLAYIGGSGVLKLVNERVVGFSLDYLDVLWEIQPTSEDVQKYQFYVERSESQAGPWDLIAGPLLDIYRVRDTSALQTSNLRKFFYRIRVVNMIRDVETISAPFDREGGMDLIGAEIARNNEVVFREYTGVKCFVFPVRTFGQRCTQCWDATLEQITNPRCPTCFRTGFVGGYHYPIKFWAQIDESDQTEQVSSALRTEVKLDALRLGVLPEIKPRDLIVDFKNRRFRVTKVGGTRRLGRKVHQEVHLSQIEPGSIEHVIPIRVGDDELLKPARTFTNAHNMEAEIDHNSLDMASLRSLFRF